MIGNDSHNYEGSFVSKKSVTSTNTKNSKVSQITSSKKAYKKDELFKKRMSQLKKNIDISATIIENDP